MRRRRDFLRTMSAQGSAAHTAAVQVNIFSWPREPAGFHADDITCIYKYIDADVIHASFQILGGRPPQAAGGAAVIASYFTSRLRKRVAGKRA